MQMLFQFKTLATATAIGLIAAGGGLAQTAAGGKAAAEAQAQAGAEVIVLAARSEVEVQAELLARGYVIVETRRTLLGRILIRAENDVHVREVVIHPATGEILRDVVVQVKGDAGGASAEAHGGGSQTGAGAEVGVNAQGGASVSVDPDSGVSVGGGVGGGVSIGN